MKHIKILVFHCVIIYCFGQTSGYTIDLAEAHKDIESLRKYFNSIDHKDAGENIVFRKFLDIWKEEGEKKLLLSQIVPMYLKMFDNIKNIELQKNINNIKMMLHTSNDDLLKQSDQKLKDLSELKKIQMTDSTTQHIAIKELFQILQEISKLEKLKNHSDKKTKRSDRRKRRGSQN
ncbi:interferon gamma [Ascaphus truei]|uniref:interferon gamma n=1 Tax=Ascaphus truei TaxID=8439 RepID=UPI003F59D07D